MRKAGALLGFLGSCLLVSSNAVAQSFSAPVAYNTQEAPADIVVADVNHDGFIDVLALQPNAHSVSVMLNDKTGALHQTGLYDTGADFLGVFGVGNQIAVGDFNGDGKLDMVVVNITTMPTSAQTVSVLLGNGDGTFQTATKYTVDGTPNSVALGDFNNDGRMDIAVIGGYTSPTSTSITLLTNTGAGFTKSSFTVPHAYGANSYPSNLTAGDFNGDGRMDLAYTDIQLCVVAPSCANATQTYYAVFNTTSGWKTHVVGTGKGGDADAWGGTRLHAADVDNDGKADLVLMNSWNRFVSVYYSKGDGTFLPLHLNFTNNLSTFTDAVAADFNNDGITDIAAVGYWATSTNAPVSGMAVFTGKGGQSGFNAPHSFLLSGLNAAPFISAGFFRAQSRKGIITGDGGVTNDVVEFRNTASVSSEPCAYPTSPGVHYCGPANGSTVTGPGVKFTSTARAVTGPVNRIELWIDGHKVFQTFTDRLNHTQTLSKGKHSASVVEVDSAGGLRKVIVPGFTVK